MSNGFIDLWTEVRGWSLIPIYRLRAASEQTWRLISQLRPWLNAERSLVYINPRGTIRDGGCVCKLVLSYGHGTTSGGSRTSYGVRTGSCVGKLRLTDNLQNHEKGPC